MACAQEEVQRRLQVSSANAVDISSAQMFAEGPDGVPSFIRCSGSQVRTDNQRTRRQQRQQLLLLLFLGCYSIACSVDVAAAAAASDGPAASPVAAGAPIVVVASIAGRVCGVWSVGCLYRTFWIGRRKSWSPLPPSPGCRLRRRL